MSVLTVDVGGANETTLELQRGGHASPRRVGGLTQGFAGSEESAIIAELMVVPFVTVPLDFVTAKTVRDLFALGAQVNCSGDVFDKPGTIVCSADITDEVDPTAAWFTLSGTLYECDSAATTYTPPGITNFLLTSVESPDSGGDPSILVSTPDGSYPGDFSSGLTLGTALTPPTASCPTQPALIISSAPEASHLSVPLAAGLALGSPTIQVETGVVSGTVWDTSSVMAKLSLKRAGSIVAGPWDSSWGAMGTLTGNIDTLTFPVTLNLPILDGDQFLIEWYARLGLACGQSDNADRPFISTGNVPGPRVDPLLIIGGNLVSL